MLTGKPARDAGFTLIELLLVIVILGVIVLPLSDAVIGVLRNESATRNRMMLSHDAQISTTFFAQDVAAMGARDYSGQVANGTVPFVPSVELNAPYNNNGHVCGTSATPIALVRLLSDDWDATATPPAQHTDVVAYYLLGSDLHRLKCTASATTDFVVTHDVDPTTPAVTCSSTCTSATVPQTVTLAFTVTAPQATPYHVTLTGQRRQT